MTEIRKSGNDVDSGDSRHTSKSAREKLMDYLAKRAHSELELRQKLARDYHEDDIDDAISTAKAKRWLGDESELASDVAASLDRKRKGHDYINQFLNKRGLPGVARDEEAELKKARAFLAQLVGSRGNLGREDAAKLQRKLASRGFDEETILRVMTDLGLSPSGSDPAESAEEAAAATDVVAPQGYDDEIADF